MIKQTTLISIIDKLSLQNFPKTVLLLGDKGSGKHTLLDIILDKFNIESINLSNFTDSTIEDIYNNVNVCFYVVDIDNTTLKQENMLLKLIEEPISTAFFILLSTNRYNIIDTVLNRCVIWELEKYSEDDLRYYLSTKYDNYPDYFYLIDIFNTPGQLSEAIELETDVKNMFDFCDIFIDHIFSANFSNSLTISNKFNFNKKDSSWDLYIFIKILLYKIIGRLNSHYSNQLYYLYNITNKLYNDLSIPNINKQYLFENYLVTCKLYNNGI